MIIRKLDSAEVYRIEACVRELAVYHNAVPSEFQGVYPLLPVELFLENAAQAVRGGGTVVEVIEDGGEVQAFCKTSFAAQYGTLDHLFVTERCRGLGYGKILMDRAMAMFTERDITKVDIKVVAGNNAAEFYERYGFSLRAVVLSKILQVPEG